jgi:threonine/homoserine/homoserine lactone efflux protein
MAVSSIAAFWAVAALLIAVPGADWAFVIGVAVRGRAIVPAVAGLVIGYAGITAIVAAGVGAAVAGSPAALTGLTLAGSLYLIRHGAMTIMHPSMPTAASEPVVGSSRGTVARGIGVSGLNPKGLLIFLALLPQFTRPRQTLPIAGQVAVLGLVFIVTVAAFYLALGAFAQTALRSRPVGARAVSRIAGAAMVVIGFLLVIDRLMA